MEFLAYHRDRSDSGAMRRELREAHWSYMDGFEAELIARGPTISADLSAATGSVHIVELPDPAAARAFAFDEPNYQAGVYRDVMLRRWRNLLGRTMWEFPGEWGEDETGFFVLGLCAPRPVDLVLPDRGADLVAFGPLLADDGQTQLGAAALLRAASRGEARKALAEDRYVEIEVHAWAPGGRPA